jgi:hypothetical protein
VKLATENWQLATGNWELATGNWQLATGNWQLVTAFLRRKKCRNPDDPLSKAQAQPLWRARHFDRSPQSIKSNAGTALT